MRTITIKIRPAEGYAKLVNENSLNEQLKNLLGANGYEFEIDIEGFKTVSEDWDTEDDLEEYSICRAYSKVFKDKENKMSIKYAGECAGCDHIRGEQYEHTTD